MSYIILNPNYEQWGAERYPTAQAAQDALRSFWKGVKGVDLMKFRVARIIDTEAEMAAYKAAQATNQLFAPSPDDAPAPCHECGGEGHVFLEFWERDGTQQTRPCSTCGELSF